MFRVPKSSWRQTLPLSDSGLVQYVRMLAMFVVALGLSSERERAPPFSRLPQGTLRASHSACASAYVNTQLLE